MTDLSAPTGPSEPIEPEPTGSEPEPTSSWSRLVALGALLFVATLAILLGLGAVAQGSGRGTASSESTPTPRAAQVTSAGPTMSQGAPSAPPSPSAKPAPSGDPVLIGAGDIAYCDRETDSETAALLAGQEGTVFTAGDNAYPDGTPEQFVDCYGSSWGRELARTRPAPGNHDHHTADLAGYLGYFGASAAPDGTAWYSYDLGSWHVIMLDATCDAAGGCSADSAQGRWLAADLASSDSVCTLAVWHEPRFSSGEHGNAAAVAPFWDALYAAGADLIVNGHDHDYERFAPQDPSGAADPGRGIREFVVGTGGAELRGFGAQAANSELRIAGIFGVIRLVLHPGAYEWSFVATSGVVPDAGLGKCH